MNSLSISEREHRRLSGTQAWRPAPMLTSAGSNPRRSENAMRRSASYVERKPSHVNASLSLSPGTGTRLVTSVRDFAWACFARGGEVARRQRAPTVAQGGDDGRSE